MRLIYHYLFSIIYIKKNFLFSKFLHNQSAHTSSKLQITASTIISNAKFVDFILRIKAFKPSFSKSPVNTKVVDINPNPYEWFS